MCRNATATAATLLAAIRPTLVNLLTLEGIADTPDGIAAIAAFDAAEKALASWTPGTSAQTVIQSLNALTQVFSTLPVPAEYKALANIIDAGIVTVIAVVTANSPAPAPPIFGLGVADAHAAPEETQAMHVAHVVASTTSKVGELVPGFKHSIWHSPASQYKGAWNKAVSKDPKLAALKQ
jgi:hypothetical protein